MIHFLFPAVLLFSGNDEVIMLGHSPIPTQVIITLSAECQGSNIFVEYSTKRPGPDEFRSIEIDDRPLQVQQLDRLNDMIGGLQLDSVSIVSCEQFGYAYEGQIRLSLQDNPRFTSVLIGVSVNKWRVIR